jgi:hypothetical protein
MKHVLLFFLLLSPGALAGHAYARNVSDAQDRAPAAKPDERTQAPLGVIELTTAETRLAEGDRERLNAWIDYLATHPELGLMIGTGPWRDEDPTLAQRRATWVRDYLASTVTRNGHTIAADRLSIRDELTSCQSADWGEDDRPVNLRTFLLRDGEIGQRKGLERERDLCRWLSGTPPN